ncbi:MAG: hypothetical protein HY897_10105 [Deltaproteobacteria bacterium]|nr:hypothetical protein [Deltaproteobacteria bacterium]
MARHLCRRTMFPGAAPCALFLLGFAPPALAQAPQPAPAAKPAAAQIAFFQFDAQGVEQKVANIVTDMFLHEVSKMRGAKVIGSREIDAMLGYEQKKQMAGCTDTSCMVAIGGALGVDKILMGSVGKLGTSYTLSLKLVDVRAASIESDYAKRIKGGSEEDFLDIIPEALGFIFPQHAQTWVKFEKSSQKGQPAQPAPLMEVVDLQRKPSPPQPQSPSLPPAEGKGVGEQRSEASAPVAQSARNPEPRVSASGAPLEPPGPYSHAGAFLVSAKYVASIPAFNAAAEVGAGYGLGRWVELSASAFVSTSFGAIPRAQVFLYNPDGALKPFAAVRIPVLFTGDGTMAGAGGAAGVQWDFTKLLGATVEAAADYYFALPEGYKNVLVFGLAGLQFRL